MTHMATPAPRTQVLARRARSGAAALCLLVVSAVIGPAGAQTTGDAAATRRAVGEAAQTGCDGVSVVVQRCSAPVDDGPNKADDALTRSRAAAKAAFDRRDRRARDDAMKGEPPPSDAPVGNAQRLGTVTVTGKGDEPAPSVEDVLQRALNPGADGVPGPNGTVSRYAPDGTRYDCIAKCVGPMCCATVRSLPNPARDSNSIGR